MTNEQTEKDNLRVHGSWVEIVLSKQLSKLVAKCRWKEAIVTQT